jgi:hypothetical protein
MPQSSRSPGLPPSPPQLAVNGFTTSAPKSYLSNVRSSPTDISAETEIRKREIEEQEASYPVPTSSVGRSARSQSQSPVIPLSPDPFGRFSSTIETANGSRQSSAYWDSVPISHVSPLQSEALTERRPSLADAHEQIRHSGANASRFSADSVNGEDAASKTTKGGNLITVKTIKKLWRKSNKTSVSGVQPTPSFEKSSPLPVPPRPERPPQEQLDLPPMSTLPATPSFGSFSPQVPPPRPERPPQEHLAALSVPVAGRSLHPPPIVASKMQHSRGDSALDRLHFDQESPYPTRRSSAARYSPGPPSPPFLPPFVPPQPEKDKSSVRKSILKTWKSASGGVPQNSISEPRSSAERSNPNGAVRARRPNFGSARGSVVSPPPDIPPSPQIPEQFIHPRINGSAADYRQSVRSKKTTTSTDSTHYSPPHAQPSLITRPSSPPQSMTSSRDSGDRRPSFDVSQFEIVSPKANSSLSYPYHGLDHD